LFKKGGGRMKRGLIFCIVLLGFSFVFVNQGQGGIAGVVGVKNLSSNTFVNDEIIKDAEGGFGGYFMKKDTYLEKLDGIIIKICLWERPGGNLYVYVINDCAKIFCVEVAWKVEENLPQSPQKLEEDFNSEFLDLLSEPIKLKLLKKYPEPCWQDKVLEIYIEK